MPVHSLSLCVWVWWLQLTALQSEPLLLLGALQHSQPPAFELLWINFLPELSCYRPGCRHFAHQRCAATSSAGFFFFLNKKTQEEQETREGQESTTKATAEITTEEVQRENSIAFPAFLLAARGLSLPPIGSKIALGFYKEQKASPPVDLSWRATKRPLCRLVPTHSHSPFQLAPKLMQL